jgi:1-deoxy-D-xylulose-5-phosphate reductoisomerase
MTRAPSSPKRLALLGATGSIGRQVCDLVERYPDRFCLRTVVAGHDAAGLEALARRHPGVHTLLATGSDRPAAARAVEEAMRDPEVDLVVVAVSGSAALGPTLAALDAGKVIALATKEVLVMAGELVSDRMRRHGSRLLPIDSEHSAIWQCLWGEQRAAVRKLVLTGSGGPFLRRPLETLESVTVAEALNHPRWNMGPKITVDSATMMNKGLEIIEAHHLFEVPFHQIEVLVHPQSVVHSMVEFVDGSVKAQLGVPDMHLPIAVALGYPDRLPDVSAPPEMGTIGELTFESVDEDRYPAMSLARHAGEAGGTAPATLNAANEVAVELFLKGRLRFVEIIPAVRSCLEAAASSAASSLEAVLEADAWARSYVENWRPGTDRLRSERPA